MAEVNEKVLTGEGLAELWAIIKAKDEALAAADVARGKGFRRIGYGEFVSNSNSVGIELEKNISNYKILFIVVNNLASDYYTTHYVYPYLEEDISNPVADLNFISRFDCPDNDDGSVNYFSIVVIHNRDDGMVAVSTVESVKSSNAETRHRTIGADAKYILFAHGLSGNILAGCSVEIWGVER